MVVRLPGLSFKRYCTPYEEMEPSLGPGVGLASCTVTCFDWMVGTVTVGAARTATGQRRKRIGYFLIAPGTVLPITWIQLSDIWREMLQCRNWEQL